MRNSTSVLFLSTLLLSTAAWAASSDEIQVYDDNINKPGDLSVDMHFNYIPSGVGTPAYEGEIPSHHDFRFTPEFGYGIDKNWEAGLYLPVIRAAEGDWHLEGAKVRMKYLADHAEQGTYWGINCEIGASSKRTEEQTWNFELRPIIGYKNDQWNLTVNPIAGLAISGDSHTPDFSPAFKVSHHALEKTWIAVEHYSGFGEFNALKSHTQETYLATDTEIAGHDLNLGVGHGWTDESNNWTVKAILNWPIASAR